MNTAATVLILYSIVGIGLADKDSDDSEMDSDDSCLPTLADRCFTRVLPSLNCYLENKGVCSEDNNICRVLAEALQCASDIIDTDCKQDEGQKNFDSWLRGLQAVQNRICSSNRNLLRDFFQPSTPCFNILDFLDCVENSTRVTHVIDFLHVILNLNECYRIMIALTVCNVKSNVAHRTCNISQNVLSDIIFTFFNNSDCGQMACNRTSNCNPSHQLRVSSISKSSVPELPLYLHLLSTLISLFVSKL